MRRSAQIAFGAPGDEQFLDLKLDAHKLAEYRWASNNSVFAEVGGDYTEIARRSAVNGEPGVLWLENARAYGRMHDAPNWAELGVDPDSLIANATHHRELLAYAAAEQVATTEVSLARAEKLPDWSVEFDYAQRGPRYSNMISLEFRMTLPIFPGGRQNPMIASKQAVLAQIQAEREDARRMHTAELRKTVAAWRSARDRVERYEHELLPLADDRVDAALAAYRGGRGDLQASLIALGQVIEQRIAYTELQNTLGQAWAALHFAFPQEH